jgi:hypothetical protein
MRDDGDRTQPVIGKNAHVGGVVGHYPGRGDTV